MKFDKSKLFKLKQALLKLGSVSTEDGTVLVYDNDSLEVGNEVFIDGDDGMQPAPDKDYVYDGKTIKVEGGIVTAIVENNIEQPTEEVEETTEPTKEFEETTEEVTEEITEEVEEPTEEVEEPNEPSVNELQEIITEQKAVIEDLQAQIEELTKKLEEPASLAAEDEFKNQKEEKTSKIDFSKYIKKNKNI